MALRRRSTTETEIKLGVRNVPEMIRRIRALGATGGKRLFEQNTLYDTPKGDFRRSGCLLRLRIERSAVESDRPASARLAKPVRAVLTAKMPGPASAGPKYKQKTEREAIVRDPAAWPGMLRGLGFRAGFRYEKCRSSFRLGGLHLDLDETPAGNYLELEGPPEAIDRAARRLGYGPARYIRETYWDLYAAQCRSQGRIPRNMIFAG